MNRSRCSLEQSDVSVSLLSLCRTLSELNSQHEGSTVFWQELAPNLKYRALLTLKLVRYDSLSEIISSNFEMFKLHFITFGRLLEGKLLQNLLSAAPSYELSFGKSGHFNFTTAGLTCSSGMTWLSNSQPLILLQSLGRPKFVLENSQSGEKIKTRINTS